MKRPVVNYREFRFSKLNTPEFSHLKLLSAWVVYFIFYFLTEQLIPAESCRVMYSPLDALIPFREEFVIFYVGWYFLVAGSLLYFLLYNVQSFKDLMHYIIVTQVIAMAVYIFFPNRQDLRPEVFPRENVLTDMVAYLYSIDTNTNVCPSPHVAYSLGIASVWLKEKQTSRAWKCILVVLVVLICLSTAFIKQHSFVDIFAALILGLLAEFLVYGKAFRGGKP